MQSERGIRVQSAALREGIIRMKSECNQAQSSIIRSHLEDGFGVTGHQRVQSGAIKYHQVSLGRRIWATGRRSSRQSPQAHSLPLRKATAELGGN